MVNTYRINIHFILVKCDGAEIAMVHTDAMTVIMPKEQDLSFLPIGDSFGMIKHQVSEEIEAFYSVTPSVSFRQRQRSMLV